MEKVVLITSREIGNLMEGFEEITSLNSSYYEQFFGDYEKEGIWKSVCKKLDAKNVTALAKNIDENFSTEVAMNPFRVKQELNEKSNKHEILKDILGVVSIKDKDNPQYIVGVYRLKVQFMVGENEVDGFTIYLAEEYPIDCIADDDKSKFSEARQTYMNALIESIVSDKNKKKVEEIEWTILAHDNDFGKEGNKSIEKSSDVDPVIESCSFLKTLCEGLDRTDNPNRFFLFRHADGDRFYSELMKKSWHTLYGFLRNGSSINDSITVRFKGDKDTFAEVLKSS